MHAIATDQTPMTGRFNNIDYMIRQLKRMGYSYDWKREAITCPEYYSWNQ